MYMQTMVDSRQLTQVHWKNGHKMGHVHIFFYQEVNKMQNVIATKLPSVVLFQHYLVDHFICQVLYWYAKTTTTYGHQYTRESKSHITLYT